MVEREVVDVICKEHGAKIPLRSAYLQALSGGYRPINACGHYACQEQMTRHSFYPTTKSPSLCILSTVIGAVLTLLHLLIVPMAQPSWSTVPMSQSGSDTAPEPLAEKLKEELLELLKDAKPSL